MLSLVHFVILALMMTMANETAKAQFLLSPQPGEVYKEFSRTMSSSTRDWRVTDPAALHSSAQQFKPNPILSMSINDLTNAIRAEVLIDQFGGHIGTTGKKFRFNNNAWTTIPELGPANGIPVGSQGQCYYYQLNPVISIPISHLKTGTNTIEGTSGAQTCYGFNWGMWGWYGIIVRVYYDPSKPHPTGTITTPGANGILTDNPTVAANVQSSTGISRVEFFASYNGIDPDGDGLYGGYQHSYHRAKTDGSMTTKNHVGTATFAPYQVTWNTDWIPNQQAGSIKMLARIRDNNGVWFVTNEISGLTLHRDTISVKYYPVTNMQERFNVSHLRATKTVNFTVPASDSLSRALAAKFVIKTWNGTDEAAELPTQTHYYKVNNYTIPNSLIGVANFLNLDIVDIPVSALHSGSNAIVVNSLSSHHGIDVLWPGPGVLVRYNTAPPTPPAITHHPSNVTVDDGATATFTVAASGSGPLSFQWQRNNVNITGATSTTYTTPPATMLDHGATYRCVVSNTAGIATSNAAIMSVVAVPPTIVRQPANIAVAVGKAATFSIASAGSTPFSFQWKKNGIDIIGATSPWYSTPVTTLADNGATFSCVVTNLAGSVTSNTGVLSVSSTAPPSIIVSDDFNAAQLNRSLWEFMNPGQPSTLTTVGAGTNSAHLSIQVPAGYEHDLWSSGALAPRILQVANNTDFEVETKFESQMNSQYQMNGIIVEQNLSNYVRFDFVRRSSETRVFAANVVNNVPTTRFNTTIPSGNPLYLRVKRVNNTWTTYYSQNGTSWTSAGSFTFILAVGRVGLFAGNAGSPIPAFTSLTDYFFNTASPISPEDGSAVPPSIITQPVDKTTSVGETVTFSIASVGSPVLAYQWRKNNVDIAGATSASYTTPIVVLADSGTTYKSIVTNTHGTATSNTVTLHVAKHPSGIVSDDFNVFGLDPNRWTFVNPVGDAFLSMTGTNTPDARVSIALPAGSVHDVWNLGNTSGRILQEISNTNFEVEAKFDSPMNGEYQIQGIMVQQDVDNYLRFDFVRDRNKIDIFAASLVNNDPTTRYDVPIADGSPLYLRVKRQGNQWNQYYSYDGVNWIAAASFTHNINVTAIGPFAGNSGSNAPAFTSLVDYFFLTADPIVHEDSGTATDTFAPVIAKIQPFPGSIGFSVNWITDEPTNGVVDYGLTTAYELGTVTHEDHRMNHSLQVLGLNPQNTYHFRLRAVDAVGNSTTGLDVVISTATPTPPVFSMWYGKTQDFGHIGNPVPRINILGNITDEHGIASLIYSLNGSPDSILGVGPDTRRLQKKGDFNIDLLRSRLLEGSNQIIITAMDSQMTVARETVTVNYTSANKWPKSYEVDWATVNRIEDVVQVVDGKWGLENGQLKILEPGYDRLVAIGEENWVDYEVTMPVTISSIDSAGFKSPSNGALIGFLLRWPGHSEDRPTSAAGFQPKSGFLPLGGFGTHNWEMNGTQRLAIIGDELRLIAEDPTFTLNMNTRYMFKMRAKSTPGTGALYSMKVWVDGTPEPENWNLTGQEPIVAPQSGCLLLVAHHVRATIGKVTVTPLDNVSTIVSDDFSAANLNTALWNFVNPRNDASVEIQGAGTVESRVAITLPAGMKHEAWSPANTSARLMQPANNASFELETRFESPLTSQIQVHGILVEQDANNFVRFDYSTSGTSTRIFSGTVAHGSYTAKFNQIVTTGTPEYMRVKRLGDMWMLYYSYDRITWTLATSFVHNMTVTAVGPYVANSGTNPPTYTAIIDYFFNTSHIIAPEDGGTGGLAVSIVGEPANQTVAEGDSAMFTLAVIGTPPLHYQWQRNGMNIPGATNATYKTPAVTVAADNAAMFRCIVSNAQNADTSMSATLNVTYPPSTFISDDFHTGALNTAVWRFINPKNDATMSFSGHGTQNARLHISLPAGVSHDVWTTGNHAPRIMQRTNNSNFELEVKFESGVSNVHQLQGILVQQSPTNFMRFDFVTHATSNITRVFSASLINGVATTHVNVNTVAKGIQPLYLKVNRQGNLWTVSYSRTGASYTTAGSFTRSIVCDSVGVFFGNAGTAPPAFTGIIDFVFNAASPISPEDGVPPTIITQPVDKYSSEGLRATLGVVASGSDPLVYQWQKNGIDISGGTSPVYNTQPLSLDDDGTTFRCLISNIYGSIMTNTATVYVAPAVPLPWWNDAWHFRVPLQVHTNGYERHDKPVEYALDFSIALASLGTSGTFNENSIRLVEVDSAGSILDTIVQAQFNRDTDFDPAAKASGTLIFLMEGVTPSNMTRLFDVYFDTVGSGPFAPLVLPARVSIGDTADFEGQQSFKIVTTAGTYFYHKAGGGFASLFDQNGNDWIGYHPYGRASGEFRGIPNAGDVFHPGFTTSSTTVEFQGPLHTRFRSVTLDNKWAAVWDIFPTYARMTMVKNGASYWWLYEGTPGGNLEIGSDFVVRSSGARTLASQAWSADMAGDEWAYFGDANMSRVLYVAMHEANNINDYYRHMDSAMTVFGFGRKDPCCIRYINTSPYTFTFGLAEDSTYSSTSKVIRSAYKDVVVVEGTPQIKGSTGGVSLSTIVSDNFNAVSLNSNLWTYYNPRGDASISMTGSQLQITVPGGTAHDVWADGNFAPRVMQPSNNTNFEIEGKFASNQAYKYQLQGFIVQQDLANFIRFDFVKNASTTNAFAAVFVNGVPTTKLNIPITPGNPIYLRVKRTGNQWTHSYSYNGTVWTTTGVFNHPLIVSSVGPFFGNAGSPAPQLVGLIDYFFNTEIPIVAGKSFAGDPTEEGIQTQPLVPEEFFLEANYPNPFNPSTNIQLGLPEPASVTLKVYNTLGQEITTLVDGQHEAGYLTVTWNGRNDFGSLAGSGVYFYRMVGLGASGKTYTNLKKMVLMK
ncbi:MAG: DUF1349 domain-containing protein [Bacteroidota bacterium]